MCLKQIAAQMKQHATLIVSSSSTVITRVEGIIHQNKTFEIIRRDREKGLSVIEMYKK